MINEIEKKEKVIVFGYSDNPEKYSNMAYNLLLEFEHEAIKFNPREQTSADLPKSCDTVALYVSEPISEKFTDTLLGINFKI